jgi:TonB family protein
MEYLSIMVSKLNKILSLVLSLSLFSLPVLGLGKNLNAVEDTTNVAQNQELDQLSDREMEGLLGKVRRVHTETIKVIRKGDQAVEGKPVLLEASTYDPTGKKIDTVYHENPNAVQLTGEEKYKYDEKGNMVEMTLLSKTGAILSKEKYEYEFDPVGNWTKMITYIAVITNGNISYEKSEVTNRTIAYYFDRNLIKTGTEPVLAENKTPGSTTGGNSSGTQTAGSTVPASSVPTGTAVAENKSEPGRTPVVLPNVIASNTNNAIVPGGMAVPVVANTASQPGAPNLSFDAPPPGVKIRPANYRFVQKSEGVLNGKAVSLPKPTYPMVAKTMRIIGTVSVEVSIDVTGRVVAAKAVSGNPILHQAAVAAALRAKFSPTLLSGQPIRVTGIISYNFSPNQ